MFFNEARILSVLDDNCLDAAADIGRLDLIVHVILHFET